MTLGRHPKFSHKVTSKSSDHELILGKLTVCPAKKKKVFRDSMLHRLIRRVLKGLQCKKENLL